MSILKVTRKQGFTLTLQNISLEKPQGVGGQIAPPSLLPVFLGMKGLIFSLKSQGIPKLRQTSIISEKPGFLSEKLKTLTSSNHHRF